MFRSFDESISQVFGVAQYALVASGDLNAEIIGVMMASCARAGRDNAEIDAGLGECHTMLHRKPICCQHGVERRQM